jgi:hypothetical protein
MIFFALVTTLVLRSGAMIPVDGAITQKDGRVVFRSIDGALYSLNASEVVRTETPAEPVIVRPEPKKLKISAEERAKLLRELENSHGGTPMAISPTLVAPPPAKDTTDDEWRWRRESRAHEEALIRAKESVTLLVERVERLQGEIRGLLGLGFKPNQFSLQAAQLQSALEQIPYAQLEVTRAQRELDQFRDDARKRDIMPGWLR